MFNTKRDIPMTGSERLVGLSLAVGVEWRPSPISRRQPATLRNRGAPCVRVFPEGHTRGVDSGGTGERHARAFLLIHWSGHLGRTCDCDYRDRWAYRLKSI